MSRIYGTNNKQALEERSFPYPQIKIWKGTKKREKDGKKFFGRDLQTQFRLEFEDNNFVKSILKEAYQAQETDGGLIVDRLNIVLYCDDPEKSFYSAMGKYKNNKPLQFCDKKHIHTRFIGDRGRPCKVNEPCKAKTIYDDCPINCKEFANLYFEILELRLAEITRICSIHLSGITDIISIGEVIDRTQKNIGAIRKSPFYSGQTQRFIVFQLTRYPKQNSFNKTNYPLLLELHPAWLREYNLYQQMLELKQLNQAVPQKLLQGIYGEELFEGKTITVEVKEDISVLEAANWKPSPHDISELRELWRKNNWTKEKLLGLLRSRFGISQIKQIQLFNKEQFEQFKSALKK